jgi:hypothetical protein
MSMEKPAPHQESLAALAAVLQSQVVFRAPGQHDQSFGQEGLKDGNHIGQ